ncbi:TetR/AcrR family transcriptional regulator [Luteolibacter luteus]|nr:TetR/AcrR family transcriptional regulator [Luteolibacter luteus]
MGRPREFDPDEALEKALRVFWAKGYEGTSMTDLTEAMGINKPSLYAAFGNKEALFRKALDRYSTGPGAYIPKAFEAPTAKEVAEKLLDGAAWVLGNPANPGGCLTIQGALVCGDEAAAVKNQLISLRSGTFETMARRFEQAKQAGEFSTEVDPFRLARYISAVVQGMSVQSASGATYEDLKGVADQAMMAWPA